MSNDRQDGWFEGDAHIRPVRIYYEDTDFSGIVYHANYLRYFERGRTDFLRCAGVGHAELLEQDAPLVFAVSHMEIAFKTPARIDDLLQVRTCYVGLKGARLFIEQDILRGKDLIATAKVEAACLSKDGRPRRLPKALIEKVSAHMSQK
ncbi:MAG: tol-pal system-associated acyl-CoA thioesterase [Pseudomonadota bacterium]